MQKEGPSSCAGLLETSRKQTEIATREKKQRFRATFEQAAIGLLHSSLSPSFPHLFAHNCPAAFRAAANEASDNRPSGTIYHHYCHD